MMDPLQYFDEEYNSHQQSISSLTSLILECHDKISEILYIQKSISSSIVDIPSIKLSIDSAVQILSLSSEVLSNVISIKNGLDSR